METVSVDCEEQGCQCCTECADEDNEPSAAPVAVTLAPSVAGTTAPPTECVDSIESISGCYAPDEPINLEFVNCEPENDDWVGIYEARENFGSLPNPPVWSWACGTRNCREAVGSDLFALDEVHASNGAWPLDEGNYVIIMARNSAQPYTAYAVSAEFTIDEGCRR